MTASTNVLNFLSIIVIIIANVNTIVIIAFSLIKNEKKESFEAPFRSLEKIRKRIGTPKLYIIITNEDK